MTEYIIIIETKSGTHHHQISVSDNIKAKEFLDAYVKRLIEKNYKDSAISYRFEQANSLKYL